MNETFSPLNNAAPNNRPLRFLLIQTAFIGDVILATPLIEQLHHYYPDAVIDLLLRKGNEGLFTNHPSIATIYTWNKQTKGKYQPILSIIAAIRNKKYDYCINLQRHMTTGIVTLLSGAKVTVGFTMNPCSRLFTRRFVHAINQASGRTHETDLYMQLLTGIVPFTGRTSLKLYPQPEDFGRCGPASRYITIAPTSVWFTKQLPAERWIAVVNNVDPSVAIYLLGASSDRPACDRIIRETSRNDIVNMAGELTLLQSAALMKGAIMNFANDSAPVHLAGAVDAPITAVFCSTIPAFGYTPLSSVSRIVQVTADLPCKPCGSHGHQHCPEGHFRCSQIAPDAILGELNYIRS